MTLTIDLPRPPSVNRIWRSRSGANGKPQFFLDKRYATWKRVCDNLCMANGWHKTPVKGRFTAVITIDRKFCRPTSDIDNFGKAPMDFLQRAGIIENDKLADSVKTRWGRAPEGCRITISPVGEAVTEKVAA